MKDKDLSPVRIEFTDARTNAGLPLRPTTLPLQPIFPESSETNASPDKSPSRSASAELVEALGGQPQTEPLMDETEPTEARVPRRAVSPEDPTNAEVEAHKLSGHACFRSWCRHCVRGRGTEGPHSRVKPPDSAVPVISWDYCYLSSSSHTKPDLTPTHESPVLVMWDSRSKGLFARLVPSKGTDFEGLDIVLKYFAADLDRLGYKKVVFRSDNEFAIVAFLKELKRYWTGEVIPEAASTGDPQSNGAAERAVRMIKGAARTIKDALEYNLANVPDNLNVEAPARYEQVCPPAPASAKVSPPRPAD